jgi:RHS repeat-associated protein
LRQLEKENARLKQIVADLTLDKQIFDGSPKGLKLISYVQDNEVIPLDSFCEQFYTVSPTYPLLVDTSLYSSGNTLSNVVISGDLSGAGLRYVLQDVQGTTRVVTNGSGTVVARHDYLPFGEEVGSNIGPRTSGQGYGLSDANRQKYGLTERDQTSGLDHTWFRKYESLSGRWTSPDPYGGSMRIGNPQSFNRYNYAQNDPVNYTDSSGLDIYLPLPFFKRPPGPPRSFVTIYLSLDPYFSPSMDYGWGGMILMEGFEIDQDPVPQPHPTPQPNQQCNRSYSACVARCVNDFRFDNVVRYAGESAGYPGVGDFAGDLTTTATAFSLLNNGLNLTFGTYPRSSPAGPAGSASSYQHRLYSRYGPIGSRLTPSARTPIANAGRATGRFLFKASSVTLALEGGYLIGSSGSCAAICSSCQNR